MSRRIPTSEEALQVKIWGARGSTSVSGRPYLEFGGNTPCIEVRCGDRLFVADAGTGIAAMGTHFGQDLPHEIDVLLTHLHLDHVGGLAFLKPAILNKERVVRTFCGNRGGASAQEALDRLYAPPLFPVRLDDLPAKFEHVGFKAGETLHFSDGVNVDTIPLNHPGGATGYRFQHAGRIFCYMTDLEHTDPWPDPELLAFVQGADMMLYDGMFSESEYTRCIGWGHSTWQKGLELAKAADVKSIGIFHLYPTHTDAHLRQVEAEIQAVMPTAFIAREGQSFSFPPVMVPVIETQPLAKGASA